MPMVTIRSAAGRPSRVVEAPGTETTSTGVPATTPLQLRRLIRHREAGNDDLAVVVVEVDRLAVRSPGAGGHAGEAGFGEPGHGDLDGRRVVAAVEGPAFLDRARGSKPQGRVDRWRFPKTSRATSR